MCYFLTERTFINEIEDKHDLESKVKVYPKFITDRYYRRKWRISAQSVEFRPEDFSNKKS